MKDWQTKNVQRQAKYIGSLASVSLALLALNTIYAVSAVAAERDYDNWYQVELVIFAQKKPTTSDEGWALENLSYPSNMLSVSPTSTDLIEPLSLKQLSEITSYEQLVPAEDSFEQFQTTNDYLFSSRRRQPAVVNNESESDSEKITQQGEITTGQYDSAEMATAPSSDPLPEELSEELSEQLPEQLSSDESATALEFSAAYLDQLFNENRPTAYKELDPAENDLDRIVRSINRSSLYRLLTHKSWRQPVVAVENAAPILIQAGHHYDDLYEIDGTIKLSRARFLHFSTDLWYTEFSPLYNTSNSSIEAHQVLDIDPVLAKAHPKVLQWENNRNRYVPIHSHPLKQSRRMRSETLHFVDHPYFGILISVKSFDYAAEELGIPSDNSD